MPTFQPTTQPSYHSLLKTWEAQRVEYLAELAHWRGISLTQLLQELNFR